MKAQDFIKQAVSRLETILDSLPEDKALELAETINSLVFRQMSGTSLAPAEKKAVKGAKASNGALEGLSEWHKAFRAYYDSRDDVTQEGLAEELGVSPLTCANWYKGKSKPNSAKRQAVDEATEGKVSADMPTTT